MDIDTSSDTNNVTLWSTRFNERRLFQFFTTNVVLGRRTYFAEIWYVGVVCEISRSPNPDSESRLDSAWRSSPGGLILALLIKSDQ